MSLSSIWRVLLRRWYVTLFGLVLTVGLAAAGAVLSPATYEAHATILLVPPKTNQQLNPYLNLGGLQEPSDAISRAVSDTDTTNYVLAHGGSGKYSIARDTSTSGPIILVTADGKSNAVALKTVQLLVDRIGPEFDKLQAAQNVPQGSYITVITLKKDDKAVIQTKSQIRSVISLAAVGIVLTILLVAFAEKTINRRKNKARALDAATETAPATEEAPARPTRAERRADPKRGTDQRERSERRRNNEPRRGQRRQGERAAADERSSVPDGDAGLFDELSSVSEHDDAASRR